MTKQEAQVSSRVPQLQSTITLAWDPFQETELLFLHHLFDPQIPCVSREGWSLTSEMNSAHYSPSPADLHSWKRVLGPGKGLFYPVTP